MNAEKGIEIASTERNVSEGDTPKKPVGPDDVVISSVQSLDEEDLGRHKINAAKKGIYLPDNFKQTISEFRKNKLYCFAFFLYVCLELAMGFKFVEFCAIVKR